jgi:hypothetical protein
MTLRPDGGPLGSVKERGRISAGLGVPQLDRALPIAYRFVGLPSIEMRDLERVEHRKVFAMPLDILRGLHDRLIVALHVRERRDQRFLQAGDVRLTRASSSVSATAGNQSRF